MVLISERFSGWSGVRDIDGLLTGYRWTVSTITFGFPATLEQLAYQGQFPPPNFRVLPDQDQQVVPIILSQIAGFTNLEFQLGDPGNAIIRLWASDDPSVAAPPSVVTLPNGQTITPPDAGDVNIGPANLTRPISLGSEVWHTIAHELGHSMGLSHTFNGSPNAPVSTAHDNRSYSVMSYSDYPGSGNIIGFGVGVKPQSYMMLDIAALQQMYGANFNSHSGDTTYKWDPATGQMFIDGVGQLTPAVNYVFLTVWDGGGKDTYDLSNYVTAAKIDLRPGEWSLLSSAQLPQYNVGLPGPPPPSAPGNVANSLLYHGDPRSLIENAIGGSAGDTIIGNDAENILTGNAGHDVLTGGGGNDQFRDTAAGLDGDTIVDFSFGDSIVITDASLERFSFTLTGSTLTYTGGAIEVPNVQSSSLSASAESGGGVRISWNTLVLAPHSPPIVLSPTSVFIADLWPEQQSQLVMSTGGDPQPGKDADLSAGLPDEYATSLAENPWEQAHFAQLGLEYEQMSLF